MPGHDLAGVIASYADRLHRTAGGHHVASPLGAWLLLALAADAAPDGALSIALGMPTGDAHARAHELLADPPPALALAAAAWHAVDTPELAAWLGRLGADVETGPMPTQDGADAWASEHTHRLIETFPLAITPRTALIAASAVACAVSWEQPFELVPAAELALPRAAGFDEVTQLLRTPSPAEARVLIADTAVGRVAVHAAPSARRELLVVSVSAAPEVPAADVLAAAHPIATALARNEAVPGQLSLFDVPLGTAHSWTLAEQTGVGPRDQEYFSSIVPAWSASSDHDLLAAPDLGFGAAASALLELLGDIEDPQAEARQSALARYTRTGFEAAAVTAIGMRAGMAMPDLRDIRIRVASVELAHPFAAVAVASGYNSRWAGLPLFSAWVARAVEAD